MSDMELEIEHDIELAARSYKMGDEKRWAAAYFSARVVGRKPVVYGATIALADRMGKSVDAVEDLAHAYLLYAELRADPKYRRSVGKIRKLPFVYYSYFRALYEAKGNYRLTNDQIMSMLDDMVQAGGKLHQEDLDGHIRERYGDTRDWTYFGAKAHKEIHKVLQQPDLPKEVRDTLVPAYEILGRDA